MNVTAITQSPRAKTGSKGKAENGRGPAKWRLRQSGRLKRCCSTRSAKTRGLQKTGRLSEEARSWHFSSTYTFRGRRVWHGFAADTLLRNTFLEMECLQIDVSLRALREREEWQLAWGLFSR